MTLTSKFAFCICQPQIIVDAMITAAVLLQLEILTCSFCLPLLRALKINPSALAAKRSRSETKGHFMHSSEVSIYHSVPR